MLNTASLMLSVTYSYAFSSYSFCSTENARLFLLHSSLTHRQHSIRLWVLEDEIQFLIQQISILQCAAVPGYHSDRRRGKTLKGS